MKSMILFWPAITAMPAMLATCGSGTPTGKPATPADPVPGFSAYWYQGEAELNRYALTQARYGELRDGQAIMVFVTEDFLTEAQVKYEGHGDEERTTVLKLNWVERFTTGIYDYSMMTSVFSPVDGTPTLKHTLSVQDWCGQSWMQANRRNDAYTVEQRSYFQSEGDREVAVGDVWLEDAVWNQLRIDPGKVPVGTLHMLPSQRYLRLMHRPIAAVVVEATMTSTGDTARYAMHFPSLERSVEIRFGAAFPHTIFGWRETRPDGVGTNARTLTTEARLTHTLMAPYWQLTGTEHDSLRVDLGMEGMP